MSSCGSYLYGFTDAHFQPQGDLRGLANAPVRLVGFRDVAAVVSDHPVETLIPRRSNLEPHHRIIRHISSEGTLVPAAFGHISETEESIRTVMQENYDEIRQELERLAGKIEVALKLLWNVPNIFEFIVSGDRELRALRDRVFRVSNPPLEQKLAVGSLFEARLNSERDRLSKMLLAALGPVVCDVSTTSPVHERVVCDGALLVERSRLTEFEALLERAASLFDSNFTLDYGGPRPPYSFVNLRLQAEKAIAAGGAQ